MEDTISISGYILSIVALVLMLTFYFPFNGLLTGLILSIIALIQCSKQKNKYTRRGKIMSIIALALGIIILTFVLLMLFGVLPLPEALRQALGY